MKKNDIITINGETFVVKDFTGEVSFVPEKALYNCYEKPSYRKQNIYNYWDKWFKECHSPCYGIRSYNCMMFTLSGIIHFDDLALHGIVYITKTRQEFYPFVEFSQNVKRSDFNPKEEFIEIPWYK